MTRLTRRSDLVRRYSMSDPEIAHMVETSRRNPPTGKFTQDANAGAVLADALDENNQPHAPFYRNLVHTGDPIRGWTKGEQTYQSLTPAASSIRHPVHGVFQSGDAQWNVRPLTPQSGPYVIVHRRGPEVKAMENSHTAVMDAPSLREWASHPTIPPTMRAHLVNTADHLEQQTTAPPEPDKLNRSRSVMVRRYAESHPADQHLTGMVEAVANKDWPVLRDHATQLAASSPNPTHVSHFHARVLPLLLRTWSQTAPTGAGSAWGKGTHDPAAQKSIDQSLAVLRDAMGLGDDLFGSPPDDRPPKKWTPGITRQKPHLFAKVPRQPKVVPSYSELVMHAAAVLDEPHEASGVLSFADHLSETHPGPMADAFQEWVAGRANHMVLAPFVRTRYVKGYVARGPYEETIAPRIDTRPQYEIQHTQSQADRHNGGVQLPSYGRRWDQPGWTVRRESLTHPTLVTIPVDRKFVPTVEVAHRLHAELGPAGLVQAIMGARHFRPDNAENHIAPTTRGTEEGGVRFTRPNHNRSTPSSYTPIPPKKVVRYAKAERQRDVAHEAVRGMPLEHALRHLANDGTASPDLRNTAKHVLTTGEPTGLWVLHDLVHQHENADGTTGHPITKAGYNFMSAADSLQLDEHTGRALRRIADEARATGRHGVVTNPEWVYGPHYQALRVANGLEHKKRAVLGGHNHQQYVDDLNHLRQRVKSASPHSTDEQVDKSIRRHVYRGTTVYNSMTNSNNDTESTARTTQPPGSPRHAGTRFEFQPSEEQVKNEKATRYRKRPFPRRYAVPPTPPNFELTPPHREPESKYQPVYARTGSNVPNQLVVAHMVPHLHQGKHYWKVDQYAPYDSKKHGAWKDIPHSDEMKRQPLSPAHLWSYDLPGGQPPQAPTDETRERADGTDAGTIPEDFYAMRRSGRGTRRRYSMSPSEIAYMIEASRLQRPENPLHKTTQDSTAGAVLADALDENDEPHAPFFRNLAHARYTTGEVQHPSGVYKAVYEPPTGMFGGPGRYGGGADGVEWSFRNYSNEDGVTATHVSRIVTSPGHSALSSAVTHVALMHPDALREWAAHPAISPSMRAHLLNAATHLEEQNKPHETKPLPMGRRKPKRYAQVNRGSFLDALRRIRSSNQKAMHQTAQEVGKKLGLHPLKTLDALHDTPHSSVPGVAQAVYGSASPEQIHSAAAWMGLTSNLPGVAVFHPRPSGPDALHRVRIDGSGMDARARLDRYGINDRIVIPHRKGFDFLIPDRGGRLTANMEKFAKESKLPVQTSQGHLKVIGSSDQASARDTFRNTVVKQEQGPVQKSRLPKRRVTCR